MAPLIALVVGYALFRTLGVAGVTALAGWHPALRWALAVMFLLTASAHWGKRRPDLVRMVPPAFPQPELLVTVTGVLEILGAIGLLVPQTGRIAAWCLAALMIAMFPANVYAARRGLSILGQKAMPIPLRALLQVVFIGCALAIAWN